MISVRELQRIVERSEYNNEFPESATQYLMSLGDSNHSRFLDFDEFYALFRHSKAKTTFGVLFQRFINENYVKKLIPKTQYTRAGNGKVSLKVLC